MLKQHFDYGTEMAGTALNFILYIHKTPQKERETPSAESHGSRVFVRNFFNGSSDRILPQISPCPYIIEHVASETTEQVGNYLSFFCLLIAYAFELRNLVANSFPVKFHLTHTH